MAVATPQRIVDITVPAEYLDDFRGALVAEIESDGEWFATHHKKIREHESEPTRIESEREDRAGALRCLLEDAEMLQQLPADENVEATVSSNGEALRHVLERVARQWTSELAHELDYGPANFKPAPGLLERLRWTVERVASIEGTVQ